MLECDNKYKERMAYFYNWKNGVKVSQLFIPSEGVHLCTEKEKDGSATGTITEQVGSRSCNVDTGQGTYRHTAQHMTDW